jgi:TonB-linked SusC/RagA family outer membrane protein
MLIRSIITLLHLTGKRIRILSTLAFAISFSFLSYAQERMITGRIVSTDNNESLPGVNILIKGTSRGTVTDFDGNYSIMVGPADSVLFFSFIGYNPKEVRIGSQTVIDVILEQESVQLDQIVVIGYGTVKKSDLTGAVSSVKTKDITKITSVNPEQSLMGKAAGVQVISTSGAPGAVPVIRIRGVGTFNNSSPIFVVDGVILDNISFLNSADIESMEILKDASATAIYGSRGANGVIIVTTKSGKIGDIKPTVSYSGEVSLQKLAKKIDLLNGKEFATIANEIRPGSYNNIDLVPNTDWQDLVFHTAPMQSHQFSASGATDRSQYYYALGYISQKGIIDKSNYERITLKLNNVYNLASFLKLGNNITIAPYKQQNAPNVTYSAYRAQPLLEPYFPDGSFSGVYNVGNPLADLKYSNDFNRVLRGVGNVFVEGRIVKAITIKSSFGVDANLTKVKKFTPAYLVYYPDGTPSQQQNIYSDLYKENNANLTWLWENTLNFNKTFNNHSLDAVIGYTMQNTTSEQFKIHGENLLRDGEDLWYIKDVNIYSDPNINTLKDIKNEVDPNLYYSMISYLFRANYTYRNRYILTFTFRRDGSSKFIKDKRFSNFPSFAAGWNITEEKFMQNIPVISKLKLRGSWGIIGNEKIQFYDRFARTQDLLVVLGQPEASNPAVSYGVSGNPDLTWESTKQTDIGLEVGIYKNKLTAEIDYYRRITDDILVQLSTPGYLGNGQGQKIRYNAASVLNRGLEFLLSYKGRFSDFIYNLGLNGSTVHNEVLEVGGNSGVDSVLIGGYLGNGIPVTQSRVGLPIGAFYGYETNGVFQTQEDLNTFPHTSQAEAGDLRFADVNNDDIINGNDRTYIGSPIPSFIFGFNADMEYAGFDFSFDIQGQTGNKIFNGKEAVRPDPYNFEKHVMDRWTGPGTSNTEPRPSWGGYNYTPSDRFIQNGSFLRLRNVTLGYTLPASLGEKLYARDIRIYLKGTNLVTLTKFTGYTPEIGSDDVLSNGIDNGIYPITAVYSFGLNLTF